MDKQTTHQKKSAAPTRSHPTKTSVKSPVHQEHDLQGAIGNRQMGLLMETHPHIHPSSLNATMVGEMPMLGGMMPVSQGRIQRQPLFGGLSQEMRLENATLALPATGALVQRKLTLGTPGDMYEEEADRVARQVVDEIHSSPFREQNAQSEEERIPAGGEAGRVQRQITVRSAGDAGGELSSEWEGELQRAKGGGQPLSPSVKEPMERAFGADFGGVRVHTGAQADRLARSIQAYAFTTGQDVFFRQGAYEPGSRRWEELLAHELTHVVQQNALAKSVWREETKEEPVEGMDSTEKRKLIRTAIAQAADGKVRCKYGTPVDPGEAYDSIGKWITDNQVTGAKEANLRKLFKARLESEKIYLLNKKTTGELDWSDEVRVAQNWRERNVELYGGVLKQNLDEMSDIVATALLAMMGATGNEYDKYVTITLLSYNSVEDLWALIKRCKECLGSCNNQESAIIPLTLVELISLIVKLLWKLIVPLSIGNMLPVMSVMESERVVIIVLLGFAMTIISMFINFLLGKKREEEVENTRNRILDELSHIADNGNDLDYDALEIV
ncbi:MULTISPECIES: DUF4157 domain-containing protein [unclassified Microcoleus]|uniref:DUF4157 domain-containing protein n=1 Tax=unclassified Microcoleus TaxID=2642155 RepID=UPI002FD3B85B